MSLGFHALGFRKRKDVRFRVRIEIDGAFGITAANCDLVHIGVGRIQQRAGFRHSHHGKRIGQRLRRQRRAFQRIERDVHRNPAGANLLADIEHRRFVALALADHHGSRDGKFVEGDAHGLHRRLVGRVFVSAPDLARGSDGCCFGHAHGFQRKGTVE